MHGDRIRCSNKPETRNHSPDYLVYVFPKIVFMIFSERITKHATRYCFYTFSLILAEIGSHECLI